MWIIRVNMTDQTAAIEEVPEAYKYLAGRAMTSNLVADEVPPLAHPLGPNNKLVFSPGILSGTPASTAARLSVGGKSPLTGGIKESNAGSPWAADLGDMQVKALVLEGQPTDKDKYWGLHLTWDTVEGKPKVEFFEATEHTGKPLADVYPILIERFGKKASIASAGLAGEHRYSNSGIAFNDMEGRATRYAGRGGLGSVMASKKVKFIVLDAKGAPGVAIADKALFDEGPQEDDRRPAQRTPSPSQRAA
jgi:aldehyde:ferredoxin oxidoreductase